MLAMPSSISAVAPGRMPWEDSLRWPVSGSGAQAARASSSAASPSGAAPTLVDDLGGLDDGMEEDIGAFLGPLGGDLLGLVVAEAVLAGAHDHGCRRH